MGLPLATCERFRNALSALPDEPSIADVAGLILALPLDIPVERQRRMVDLMLRQIEVATHEDHGDANPDSRAVFLSVGELRAHWTELAPQLAERFRRRLPKIAHGREQARLYQSLWERERSAHARTLAERDYWRGQAREIASTRSMSACRQATRREKEVAQ